MNLALAFADLHAHRLAGDAVHRASASARSSRTRRRPAAGLEPGDAILAVDGAPVRVLRRSTTASSPTSEANVGADASTLDRSSTPTARIETIAVTLRTADARSTRRRTPTAIAAEGRRSAISDRAVRAVFYGPYIGRDLPTAIGDRGQRDGPLVRADPARPRRPRQQFVTNPTAPPPVVRPGRHRHPDRRHLLRRRRRS